MQGLRVGFATVLACAILAAPAAANSSKANTETIRQTETIFASGLQTCLKYTVTGSLKYAAKRYGPTPVDNMVESRLENVRFVDPGMSVQAYKYDPGSHACTTRPHTWSSIEVTQRWAGYDCNWNPRITINPSRFPVGLSFWPDCGPKDAAVLEANSDSGNAMNKTWDLRVEFPNQNLGLWPAGHAPEKPECYGFVMKFVLRNGGDTQDFKSPVRHRVCPTPQW